MEAKRWGQIKEVYDRALDLRDEERAGFLAEACAADRHMSNIIFIRVDPAYAQSALTPASKRWSGVWGYQTKTPL
jgi:hypothetical protein